MNTGRCIENKFLLLKVKGGALGYGIIVPITIPYSLIGSSTCFLTSQCMQALRDRNRENCGGLQGKTPHIEGYLHCVWWGKATLLPLTSLLLILAGPW